MKKHVMLALLILFLGSSFVFAGAFGAGVSAGGSMAFVGTEPSGEGTPRYGFTGGVYGDYAFYAIENVVDFSVQPGVYFAMKGFRTELEDFGDAKMEVNMNYIEVPVLLKATFDFNLPVKPFVLVGPSVGYAITKEVIIPETVPSPWNEGIVASYEEDTSNFDFGLVFGAGVDLDMGISIDARFNLGLLNIDNEATGDDYTKNRSVSLMVSYNIL